MKFEAFLADICSPNTQEQEEKRQRDGITAQDMTTILGVRRKDGEGIVISSDSWKRLELFMALLSGVNMSISEKEIKDILEAK